MIVLEITVLECKDKYTYDWIIEWMIWKCWYGMTMTCKYTSYKVQKWKFK